MVGVVAVSVVFFAVDPVGWSYFWLVAVDNPSAPSLAVVGVEVARALVLFSGSSSRSKLLR